MYLDDIISFGSTFDGALANLTLIFERLRSYGLQLKSSKCHLFRASVPFLGHIVGRHGLECDPKKIEDVKSWPVPDCLKSVRQFLGFVGYYRRFIPSFADVATPLVSLTGKDVPFVWDSSCSTAFGELRAALIDAPILGKDHGNADGLSRAPSSPCRQCTRPDCPPAALMHGDTVQPFDSVSTGSSEDADLVPVQSGEDWIARIDDDLSQPAESSGDSFRISALQREDPVCITLHAWIVADELPPWA